MFPLDVPIVIQDGIVVALFASALGFLLYKKLRKKTKTCPACSGDCNSTPQPPAAIRSNQSEIFPHLKSSISKP